MQGYTAIPVHQNGNTTRAGSDKKERKKEREIATLPAVTFGDFFAQVI